MASILVIDDERAIRNTLKEVLEYAKDVNDANQKQDEVKKDE